MLQDYAFITFNRIVTIPFMYVFLYIAWHHDGIPLDPRQLTLANTLLPLPLLFVVYDFVYTIMHRVMHINVLYPLVHKHHHRQHSPSRGNTDAVNVHPLEFALGEFLHIGSALALLHVGMEIHAITLLVFILVGGVLASLNHTRFDVRIPPAVYDVR